MMYILTKTNRRLYGKEFEKYLTNNMGRLSVRTIHRWTKYLIKLENSNYSFDYFPVLNFSLLGLIQIEFFLENPVHLDVSLLIPHNYYHGVLKSSTMNDCIFVQYLIPPEKYNNLIQLHERMKNLKIINNYQYYRIIDVFYLPSPFHKVISDNHIVFNDNIDNSFFINKMKLNIIETSIHKDFHIDPFKMAVIFESDKDMFTYEQLANIFYEKRRCHLENYPKIPKIMESKKVFTNHVKNSLHNFYKDRKYQKFLCIYYKYMFEMKDRVNVIVFFRHDHIINSDFKNLINNISMKNVFISIHFILDRKNDRMIKLHLNSTFEKIFECLETIKNIDNNMYFYIVDKNKYMGILDREHAKYFYWELFDPIEIKWKFETEKYFEKIDNFNNEIRKGNYRPSDTFKW